MTESMFGSMEIVAESVDDLARGRHLSICSISPYIVRHEAKYYRFGEAIVGMPLDVSGGEASIHGSAKVVNAPYGHPYVYSDGSIDRMFIDFEGVRQYDLSDADDRERMHSCLRRAFKSIADLLQTFRVNGRDDGGMSLIYPVKRFAPVAYSLSDARRYARGSGIGEGRIFRA